MRAGLTMRARHLLVVYDISDRRRWRRVYKLLCRHGEWLQLSAFRCRLGDTAARRLEAELRRLMDPATDRLLVVKLSTPFP